MGEEVIKSGPKDSDIFYGRPPLRNLWWIDVYLCYFWLWSSLGIGQVVYSLAAKPRAAPVYSSAL